MSEMGYTPDQMEVVARELGIMHMNLLLSEQLKEKFIAELKARDERIELLTNKMLAYETDINNLRAQIGAAPIRRRGEKVK
jgi:hypothetical protein